jgi:uncharacterized Zn finger protein (UPF0148 family)
MYPTYHVYLEGFIVQKNSKDIKIMADLLKQGATLTKHACPACSSPIFRLKSKDLWCAICKKHVIFVREGELEPEVPEAPVFSSLESTILVKIQEIEKQFVEENDTDKLKSLGATLSTLLESLEKIRNIKK